MAYNIGINVIETEGKTSPALAGAPTSVAGFILRSRRGPTDEAVRVSSFRQFTERFGGYAEDYVGAYCVEGFFLNGGQEAWIARVVGADSKAASIKLKNGNGDEVLTVSAGYRGQEDVGSWGNDLYLYTKHNPIVSQSLAATVLGNEPARLRGEPRVNADLSLLPGIPRNIPRTLRLKINGQPLVVTFNNMSRAESAKDIVDAINAEAKKEKKTLKAFVVRDSNSNKDCIDLVNTSKGQGSAIEIVNETHTLLGFKHLKAQGRNQANSSPATSAILESDEINGEVDLTFPDGKAPYSLTLKIDGKDQQCYTIFLENKKYSDAQAIVTYINSSQAINDSTILDHLKIEVSANKKIKVSSNTTGTQSQLEIIAGTLSNLGFISGSLTANGKSNSPGEGKVRVVSNKNFKVGDQVRLDDGLTQDWRKIKSVYEDTDANAQPRYWITLNDTIPNQYRIEDGAKLETCEFDLVVRQKSPVDNTLVTVETWEKLSLNSAHPNNIATRIKDSSQYLFLVASDESKTWDFKSDHEDPKLGYEFCVSENEHVSDGDIAIAKYRDALSQFDILSIQLLTVPETFDSQDSNLQQITKEAIDYCTRRGDCFFVGHTPREQSFADAKSFGRQFQEAKSYGALYWPWIAVTNPIRGADPIQWIPPTGHVMGTYARIDQTRGIWKAPAGNEAVLRGALAVERDITDVDHTDLVKNGSVNGIRNIRGAGIVIDASRTLSTDTRWLYVNVRLLFNYVKVSLREGLRWVKQEPNREVLWNTIKYNTVTPFLQGLYQAGAFGPGAPEAVFTIVCGAENNPPSEIMLGNLKVEIYFYPARPAETIIIIVGQQDSATSER